MGARDQDGPGSNRPVPSVPPEQNLGGRVQNEPEFNASRPDVSLDLSETRTKNDPLEATFTTPIGNQEEIMLSKKEIPPPEGPTDLKSSLPQIFACSSVSSFNFAEGMALSYSSALIPQLLKDKDIKMTFEQGINLGSMMVLAMATGALAAGFVMNRFGRVNAMRLSTIPYGLGWILVALGVNFEMILVGRLLTGFSMSMGVSTACVYNTEVASPHIRGALNAACPAEASLGCLVTYVLGAYTHWRTHAWICTVSPVITLLTMQKFAYESPTWLVSKGRLQEAEKSLRALARYNKTHETRELLPERQLAWMIQSHKLSQQTSKKSSFLDIFRMPVGYKPLIIMALVFAAQQFSGTYITLFFAATFFQKMGSSMEYTASIWIGVVRFIFGMIGVALIRNFGVRPLMVFSSTGMALCMALSGYLTMDHSLGLGEWAPTTLILMYVAFSCCGLLLLPWAMTAEVYCDQLRDVGNALTMNIALLLMFLGLQLYPTLESGLGGSGQLQIFFAAMALCSVVITILFLPETRGKSLHEIEQHYKHNFLWIGRKKIGKEAKEIQPSATTLPVTVSVLPVQAGGV